MLVKLPLSVSRCNGKLRQYLAAVTVSLGAFTVGTVLSWTSAALPWVTTPLEQPIISNVSNALKPQQFPNFQINRQQEALVGAMLTVGALVSSIPSGCLADKFGRKIILLTLAVPFFIHWIFIINAKNVGMLVFARFTAGISVGGVCVVAPMYIAEIADISHRGMFGSFFQMFLCSGILFTTVIGSVTSWASLSLVLGCIPVLFLLTFYSMPEAPIYLLKKNKLVETETTLKELRGINCDIREELESMQKELQMAKDRTVTIFGILRNKAYVRAIISVVGILALQQLSGINAIIFYTVSIFEAAGSNISPNVAAITINLVQVVVSYASTVIIERADRKLYLMLSAVGMFLCLSALGIYFHFKFINVDVTGFLRIVPIASTVLFMAAFSIGFGPIPWMLMGELFAPEIKGPASGVAILASWMFAFIVTLAFPIVSANLGSHVTFYMFSGFMASAVGFIHFVVPETRGKSLLEIQKDLCK